MNEYSNLKDQIQTWQGLISGSKPSAKRDVESVFQTFNKRINDLAQGCLMRNIDFKVHADIMQLIPIIRKARQIALKRSGLMNEEEYDHDGDEEDDKAFLSSGKLENTEARSTPKGSREDINLQGLASKNTTIGNDITMGIVIDNIIQLKEKQKYFNSDQLQQSLSRKEDEAAFSGFSTVMEEIQTIKALMEKNRRLQKPKIGSWRYV